MRKPVFGVSDQAQHRPGCTDGGKRFIISDLGSRGIAKTKALISCAVTAQLICVFVSAYAKRWFSYNEAHIIQRLSEADAPKDIDCITLGKVFVTQSLFEVEFLNRIIILYHFY